MTDYMSDWQEPPPQDIEDVEDVEVPEAFSTVAIGLGIRGKDGCMIRFAGDWRQMLEIAEAIRDTGEAQPCDVPAFAVLGVSRLGPGPRVRDRARRCPRVLPAGSPGRRLAP
jgi:hypothetical protein